MMNESYHDLREWLDVVESRGELNRITGADWDLEMSGLTEIVYREGKEPKPALLFDGIPNYPKGYRTLFGMLGSFLVDDDVDPSNLDEVIWAILTRNDPKQAIQILDRCHSSSADTAISPEEKRKYKVAPKPLTTSNAIIDACRPYEWKSEWYPMARVSPELRTKIFKKWDVVSKKIL